MFLGNGKFFLSFVLASFVGYYMTSVCDGQKTVCRTSKNESALCVPAQNCRIGLTLTRTTNVRGLSVRQLSVRYCGTLINTAYVCCPREEIIIIPDDDSINTNNDNFVKNLNPVGLGILKSTQCGAIDPDTYINGMKTADNSKFPWIARLTKESGSPLCVGTVITNQYILTTTHCSSLKDIKKVRIDLVNDTQSGIFGVESLIQHPNKMRSDIGLLRLDRTMEFGALVQPICLPISSELANYNLELGYLVGKDIEDKDTKTFVVPNLSSANSKCIQRANKNEICINCGEADCKIGAGSPLFFPAMYLRRTRYVEFYVLWGGVAGENFYTKVAPYMKWITETLVP